MTLLLIGSYFVDEVPKWIVLAVAVAAVPVVIFAWREVVIVRG